MNILKINSSIQAKEASISRQLVDELIQQIASPNDNIIDRDLSQGVGLLNQELVQAFYTPVAKQTSKTKAVLNESDRYVSELQAADTLVLGLPIYNFSVPGALKAYFDLVARVGLTFKYSEKGPIGLLKDKKAYVVIASGGTKFQSDLDFASKYIQHFLGFIGITDVSFIDATGLLFGKEAALARAKKQIKQLPALQVQV